MMQLQVLILAQILLMRHHNLAELHREDLLYTALHVMYIQMDH